MHLGHGCQQLCADNTALSTARAQTIRLSSERCDCSRRARHAVLTHAAECAPSCVDVTTPTVYVTESSPAQTYLLLLSSPAHDLIATFPARWSRHRGTKATTTEQKHSLLTLDILLVLEIAPQRSQSYKSRELCYQDGRTFSGRLQFARRIFFLIE